MRSRNIKPGFFENEELAEGGPCAQILFEALWCLADREGILENRPLRIKVKTFPYYDPKDFGGRDIYELLDFLAGKRFIRFYTAEGLNLIHIAKFHKHQSPHNTEKQSTYPKPPGNEKNITVGSPLNIGSVTLNSPKQNGENPPDSLIHRFSDAQNPDSLNPDSLIPEKDLSPEVHPATPNAVKNTPNGFKPERLAELWNEMAPSELPRVNLPFKRKPKDLQKIKTAIKLNPELEWWRRVFQRLFESPFLRGDNDRAWKASFDFVVEKAEQIIDGKYDGQGSALGATLNKSRRVAAGGSIWIEERLRKREVDNND